MLPKTFQLRPQRPGPGWSQLVTIIATMGMLAIGTMPVRAETRIDIEAVVGLQFSPARFAVPPGEEVVITFNNPDDMMHNLVVTRPGARVEVVNAALALGAEGPRLGFVPDHESVLWATSMLNPNERTELRFTAPSEEAAYPFVCTFPGHGFVMYGVMYVHSDSSSMPPLADDPHLPAAAKQPVESEHLHEHQELTSPVVSRTFLPDSSPASLAVGLPGGQSFCFDTARARIRYVWRDGFVDNSEQFHGKGDTMGRVQGTIYFRPTEDQRLRIGPRDAPVSTEWLGYRLIDGYPEFHYRLDGAEVRELVRANPDGSGLAIHYRIKGATAAASFATNAQAGASLVASAGARSGGIWEIPADQTESFTVTFSERPGREPVSYWSMDDLYASGRKEPVPGVVGRAYAPKGWLARKGTINTGVSLTSLRHGGTLMGWVKSVDPGPVFGVHTQLESFAIASPAIDGHWHHVTVVFDHDGMTTYLDGKLVEKSPPDSVPELDAPIYVGSIGRETFFIGLLDEMRVYNRALPVEEIHQVMQDDRQRGVVSP